MAGMLKNADIAPGSETSIGIGLTRRTSPRETGREAKEDSGPPGGVSTRVGEADETTLAKLSSSEDDTAASGKPNRLSRTGSIGGRATVVYIYFQH